MCILFLSYQPLDTGSPYVLIAANNRDEFFERKTTPAAFWQDHPTILAGRDVHRGVSEGGTWLGITREGRFGVLTNFRCHHSELRPDTKSRGLLVRDFLLGDSTPVGYTTSVMDQGHEYNGFNLITATLGGNPDSRQMVYCSNAKTGRMEILSPGVYGLSNQLLDSPWKKVVCGKEEFVEIVGRTQPSTTKQELTDQLMELLCTSTCFHPDPSIPDTGFSEEVLKSTSSIFVHQVSFGDQKWLYGTRTNTVVLVARDGEVTFVERTMVEPIDSSCPQWQTSSFTFHLPL